MRILITVPFMSVTGITIAVTALGALPIDDDTQDIRAQAL